MSVRMSAGDFGLALGIGLNPVEVAEEREVEDPTFGAAVDLNLHGIDAAVDGVEFLEGLAGRAAR